MYILQRLNVEKHTDDENIKNKLIAEGFKLVEPIEEKPVKEKKPKK